MTGILLSVQLLAQVWNEAALARMETPLKRSEWQMKPAAAEAYYKLPVVQLFKSYPVYRPDREPNNYVGFLQAQNPEPAWDPKDLKTDADWIRAGELLFDTPARIGRLAYAPVETDPNYLQDKSWWNKLKPPVSFEASLPSYKYVIRKKGLVEVGVFACSMCHSRIMPNGIVEMGPASQFPFDAALAEDIRKSGRDAAMVAKNRTLLTSWYFPQVFDGLDHQQMALKLEGHPYGVMSIDRTTPESPVKVPDLIGVASLKYLGATGLSQQNGTVEDLMRYIAGHFSGLTAPGGARFSDEQLKALAMYLTNLKPPKNPYKPNSFTKKGKAIFDREGCPACHPAPLYTNNQVMAASEIGTDPELTTGTRRGTGFYRVPPLTGLWYRGPFGHDGTVAELEQWLDGSRLRSDFFRNGPGGLGGRQAAVKGHEFGMRLTSQEMAALLAFLRTL